MKRTPLILLLASCVSLAAREISQPLGHHPGNIFVAGEAVTIPLPTVEQWKLYDYDERDLGPVRITNGQASLGKLPVGWYRLRGPGSNQWISAGVIEVAVATRTNSPISIDVAMSWFYPTNRMRDVASLCALAGANWVRDRLNWAEMEPTRGRFAGETRYDAAARVQRAAELQVLQVNHSSPKWAGADSKRFPQDLRDAYTFYREMARRWNGAVLAFEPWNEADIPMFGGHTGAEMASFQKAAYLGLKAGNSNVLACLNVWAVHRRTQLDDFAANEASAYFDTYNLHHYEPIERYPALYADHRAVSAGKPMWVTEFAMPVKWSGDEKLKEPGDAELRSQSERLVKAFAASLFEGPQNSFYFMFPHYVEGQTQFGIVRPDLTPRPAYLSFAAVGRLLGDARIRGRIMATNKALHAYCFKKPASELLVTWSDSPMKLDIGTAPQATFDHLGRRAAQEEKVLSLSAQPLFVRVPPGSSAALKMEEPPRDPLGASTQPSTLVLQPLLTASATVLTQSAWRILGDKPATVPLAVYNFGRDPLDAAFVVTAPAGWKVENPPRVHLAAGAREELSLTVDCSGAKTADIGTVRITVGDEANRAVLSMRLLPTAQANP